MFLMNARVYVYVFSKCAVNLVDNFKIIIYMPLDSETNLFVKEIIKFLFIMNAMRNGYSVSIMNDGTMHFSTTYDKNPKWWLDKKESLKEFVSTQGKGYEWGVYI